MSVNKVILVGNLGKDPEVRYLEGGVAVASFTLATSESYKDRKTGEKTRQTEWHNVVLWRGLAEITEKYLKKGSQVYIEGKLRTRSWEDQAGQKRYTTEIVADNMTMLGSRESGSSMSAGVDQSFAAPAKAQMQQQVPSPNVEPTSSGTSAVSSAADDLDDLPF